MSIEVEVIDSEQVMYRCSNEKEWSYADIVADIDEEEIMKSNADEEYEFTLGFYVDELFVPLNEVMTVSF